MNWVRKGEICKAMGGRRFNGEGGRRKVGKESKCNENTELESRGGEYRKVGAEKEGENVLLPRESKGF